jgi:hypothetical protein
MDTSGFVDPEYAYCVGGYQWFWGPCVDGYQRFWEPYGLHDVRWIPAVLGTLRSACCEVDTSGSGNLTVCMM